MENKLIIKINKIMVIENKKNRQNNIEDKINIYLMMGIIIWIWE